MERDRIVVTTSDLGPVAVSSGAIAQVVRSAALESYGVVGLSRDGSWRRLLPWTSAQAIEVRGDEDGLHVDLHVVVEHGLRLAEVGAAVRSRVEYELARMVGLPIVRLEVHIERVRSN